ncbi:uncharacterized protein LOC116292604 [Actinia tenebrosa]|uniref:Uncharacterized protein LOC116292604 n=1 Tax=Actinia tenebrosa TaxID=6105 RepID=A0A6P8HIX7_ACTTE|nr:uncharacterized protein LOC116292604 [Actinia tenebrosa]
MTHILTNPHLPPQGVKFRSKSAEISRKHVHKGGLSNKELDRIRSFSRQSWNRLYEDPGNPLPRVTTNHYQTTYTTSFSYKKLDETTPSRATSPTRRNNPHPTKAFLHLRIREASGFPRPKIKLGQDPNRVPGRPEKEPINIQRTMYYTLKEIKDLQKRGADGTLKAIMQPKAVPITQAWMKNASKRDVTAVTKFLEDAQENGELEKTVTTTFKPDIAPAVNRWLKQAGNEEREAVMRLIQTLSSDPYQEGYINPKHAGQLDPDRYLLGKYTLKDSTRDLTYDVNPDYRRKRTEFSRVPASFL